MIDYINLVLLTILGVVVLLILAASVADAPRWLRRRPRRKPPATPPVAPERRRHRVGWDAWNTRSVEWTIRQQELQDKPRGR